MGSALKPSLAETFGLYLDFYNLKRVIDFWMPFVIWRIAVMCSQQNEHHHIPGVISMH